MTLAESKKLIEWAKDKGLRRVRSGTFEVEFFEQKPAVIPMSLDPKTLSKVFTETMPPDSLMQFASSEGIPDDETPTSQQRDSAQMT